MGWHAVPERPKVKFETLGTQSFLFDLLHKKIVLVDTLRGSRRWSTVGASPNIIEASWRAIVDAIEYGLVLDTGGEERA